MEFRANNFSSGDLLALAEFKDETELVVPFNAVPEKLVFDMYIVLSGDVELVSWRVE